MSKLDSMTNLRGGVIYHAARVAPTTARTWPLNLGESRDGGHPRYRPIDAVALTLMNYLTTQVGITAAPAGMIVNALRPFLPRILAEVVAQQEQTGHWRWNGGPFAIITRKPVAAAVSPVETWMIFVESDDPGSVIADQRSGLAPLVIPLRRLINKSVMSLQLVLNGEMPPIDGGENV